MGAKSGTYYANARFYGADVGRFTQADAAILGAPGAQTTALSLEMDQGTAFRALTWIDGQTLARGNPQAINRYAYTLNNPVKYKDPTGQYVGGAINIENWSWTNGFKLRFDFGVPPPPPPPPTPDPDSFLDCLKDCFGPNFLCGPIWAAAIGVCGLACGFCATTGSTCLACAECLALMVGAAGVCVAECSDR